MKKLPRGLRKYIRKEKARVRREVLSEAQRNENLKIIFESIKIPSIQEGDKNQTTDLKKRKPVSKKLAKGANLHEE